MPVAAQPAAVPEPTPETRRSLVARRTTTRIVVDGRLDEAAWQGAAVARDFAQVRQDYAPTTRFPSEVRILFDDDYLYVGAFNADSAGLASLRMQDLRRDFESGESDVFGVTFGSLGDGRTAFQFQASPLGSQADVQAFDGGDVSNFNWDALWRVRTTRSDTGWVAEFAIPWRSMRYQGAEKPGVFRANRCGCRAGRLIQGKNGRDLRPRGLGLAASAPFLRRVKLPPAWGQAGRSRRKRTKLYAAHAKVTSQSTRAVPRCFTFRRPATVFSQPNTSSIFLRARWLIV